MAVNLPEPGDLSAVAGFRLATGAAGIRNAAATGTPVLRDDLVLVSFPAAAAVAGVFTQSSFRAAPVQLAQARLRNNALQALLINSGNANAATGTAGLADAEALCQEAATALGIPADAVAPFSTGVIGERLPVEQMARVIRDLPDGLNEANWLAAGRAIMTTDTVPKVRSRRVDVAGVDVHITGMAKGSGMIRPDMATLLAFVACDAAVDQTCLQQLLRRSVAQSFNRITVDGDTSTNDSLVMVATGAAGNSPITDPESAAGLALQQGFDAVCRELAQAIVRDAEGASKFVTVRVAGGRDEAECLTVAYTVAESPLVKTALFASDPNWGRLAMAIGRAGVADLDVAGVAVWFDDVQVMDGGIKARDYTEAAGAEVLARDEVTLKVELGRGSASTEIWTSDLSYEYVRINAEYRT